MRFGTFAPLALTCLVASANAKPRSVKFGRDLATRQYANSTASNSTSEISDPNAIDQALTQNGGSTGSSTGGAEISGMIGFLGSQQFGSSSQGSLSDLSSSSNSSSGLSSSEIGSSGLSSSGSDSYSSSSDSSSSSSDSSSSGSDSSSHGSNSSSSSGCSSLGSGSSSESGFSGGNYFFGQFGSRNQYSFQSGDENILNMLGDFMNGCSESGQDFSSYFGNSGDSRFNNFSNEQLTILIEIYNSFYGSYRSYFRRGGQSYNSNSFSRDLMYGSNMVAQLFLSDNNRNSFSGYYNNYRRSNRNRFDSDRSSSSDISVDAFTSFSQSWGSFYNSYFGGNDNNYKFGGFDNLFNSYNSLGSNSFYGHN